MKVRLSIVLLGIAAVILGAAFVFATGRQRGELRPVTAVLPRADGLREGAIVTYLGLEIGYVDRLRIHEGRVIAELKIHRDDAILRRSDSLRLRTMGVFGDKLLDISPGSRAAPVLGPTDTLTGLATPATPLQPLVDSLRQSTLADSQPGDRPCFASHLGLPCR